MKTSILSTSTLALLLLFIIQPEFTPVKAQREKQIVHLSSVITDSSNFLISFAHIINFRRGYATISDTSGIFKMPVMSTDSLRISAIGYQTKIVSIKNYKIINDSIKTTILLKKRTYSLPTVNIYELRWQVFKSEFMEETIAEDKTAKRITLWMNSLFPAGELRMVYQGARGVGFALPYRTKAEKSRKKVAALERKYAIIQPKFNDHLLMEITGLKGKELNDFIEYCQFGESFLLYGSEYSIIDAIQKKFEAYNKLQLNKEKLER